MIKHFKPHDCHNRRGPVCLTGVLLLCWVVLVQSNAVAGQSIGIFIGVNNYDLKYAAEDAKRQAEIFGGTFNYETAVFSTDSTNDPTKKTWSPTKSNLKTHIPMLLNAAGPSDTVIVSFSGHGILDEDGAGYLVPQDAELDSLITDSLPLEWLRDQLRMCRAGTKLLVLDCCHAGTEKGIGVRLAAETKLATGGDFAKTLRDETGLLTLASCRSRQKSYELPKRRQGLFTHFLIEGLLDGADLPPKDRKVTITELYGYVLRHVTDYADRELEVNQTPVLVLDKAGVLEEATIAKWADPKIREVASLSGHRVDFSTKGISAVGLSSNGTIATYTTHTSGGSSAQSPLIWDLATGRRLPRLNGNGGPQYAGFGSRAIAISPAGDYVAAEGHWAINFWKTSEPQTTRKIIGAKDRLTMLGAGFSPDGKLLATSHTSNQLLIWNIPAGRKLLQLDGAAFTPRFSPDGREVCAGAAELEVKIWSLSSASFPLRLKYDSAVSRSATIRDEYNRQKTVPLQIHALEYTSDSKQLMAVAGVRGLPFHVSVWDAQTTDVLHKRTIGRRPSAAAIVPGHKFVLLGDADGTIGLWNVITGKEVFQTDAHSKAVDGIAISADGSTVISGGQDMKVLVFKLGA